MAFMENLVRVAFLPSWHHTGAALLHRPPLFTPAKRLWVMSPVLATLHLLR